MFKVKKGIPIRNAPFFNVFSIIKFIFTILFNSVNSSNIKITPCMERMLPRMKRLILGSQSPRRKDLLHLAGYDFEVRPSRAEEIMEKTLSPDEAVLYLARFKAEAISLKENEVLLTSDTVVVQDNEILGKPADLQEARNHLKRLSGRTHQVYTGVCISTVEEQKEFFVLTDVTFFPLTDDEIDDYIETGEVWDKAGSYGIQGKGALFVEKIHGDYYSVVGLPLARVVRELKTFGIVGS
ncbi:septum formation protein [Halobacillus karajensis]|nr:Septum formation protein Maf [Halobacillus karajensis]CDQ29221.1 Septum formation protein Maf [Halobacillus karajensis]SEH57747.1 septum formation protein [Halobacillus karajensis]